MITVKIYEALNKEGNFVSSALSEARKLGEKHVKTLKTAFTEGRQMVEQEYVDMVRKVLKKKNIAFVLKEKDWVFTAKSGEKISLPRGFYTQKDGVLHQINVKLL